MALRALNRALLLAARSNIPAASSSSHLQHLLLSTDNQEKSKSSGNRNPFFSFHWHRLRHTLETGVPKDAVELLQQTNILQLRQEIEDEALHKVYITYQQLLGMCRSSGAAATQDEAEQLVKVLVQAGVVLKYRDIMYLRPNEVAEIILQALPSTKEETRKKLDEVEAELKVLQMKHHTIEKEARKWPNFFLYGGCLFLAVQLVAFARLTFYELSWDVMEPVAYFVSLFYTLVGYIYFLVFRNGFDYPIFEEYWKSRNQERHMQELHFDPQRYHYLLRLQERYKNHLAALGTSPTSS